MGGWVAVTAPLDKEAIRAFGEEVCIDPNKAVAKEIDTDGDGKADQVVNFAPVFCQRDVTEENSFAPRCDDNALQVFSQSADRSFAQPIFTARITDDFPSVCRDGTEGCTTFRSAEYYVGQFIAGDPSQQLAVIGTDGTVQLFRWEPDSDISATKEVAKAAQPNASDATDAIDLQLTRSEPKMRLIEELREALSHEPGKDIKRLIERSWTEK